MLVAAVLICGLGYRAVGLPGSHAPAAAAALRDPPDRAQLGTGATAAVAKLATMYDPSSNKATRSWRAANILAALTRYMQASGSRAYLSYLRETYQVHPGNRAFINKFYDDEGWWALTWIGAYDLTRDPRYLDRAKTIFADLTRGWTRTCGGGLLWNKFRKYKDAISNELFLQVAAELHARSPGDVRYQRWALREWGWLRHSGLIRRSGLVVDGLTSSCHPVAHSPLWTYNQGELIGSLLDLRHITHQQRLLRLARKTASAVIHSRVLSPHGILTEPCQPGPACGLDAPSFKGIFMENLQRLYSVTHRPAYRRYLLRNAQSLWLHDRRGAEFGLVWAGPIDSFDPARQLSAVDLLISQVSRAGQRAASPLPSPDPAP